MLGGGVTGALAAVRLAERGFDVTVLEKAAIGNGSSSRSNACIRAQFGVEETVLGMMYSEEWYARFHDHMRTPPEHAQPAMQSNGYLFLYEDPAQAAPDLRVHAEHAWRLAQERAAMQRRLGLPVEQLEPGEVQRRWPHLDGDRLIGATWCPTDGFLHPHVIYGEGFRRARELGVEVRQGTEAVGAEVRGGRITRVATSRGQWIEADWVVNATNAWAPRVSRALGGMALPIAPLKRYLYHMKLARPILSDEAWGRLPMTIYGLGPGRGAFSRPDGPQLIVGWSHETAPEPDFADADQDRIAPDFSHEHGLDNFGYATLAQVVEFAPILAEVGGLAATTCGYYGMTPDGVPLIGRDASLSNLVHAAGFSGHGIMHAPITALLVEAILNGEAAAGAVRLPAPFERHSIRLAAFDPRRDFAAQVESVVL